MKKNKGKVAIKTKIRVVIAGVVGLILIFVGIFVGSFLTSKDLMEVKLYNGALGVDFMGNNILLLPSKIWLEDVPLGSSTEQCIYVINNSGRDMELSLNTISFSDTGGYEPINPQWVSLDNGVINIAARSRAKVFVRVDMPQKINGKAFEFMVGVKDASPSVVNVQTCAKFFVDVQ
jgi:hypothetical protein